MLNNFGGEFPYKMSELYKQLGLSATQYKRWVKSNLTDMFEVEKDYQIVFDMMSKNPPTGRPKTDYILKRRTAEELALLAKTPESRILRNWLLNLKDAVDTYEYLTIGQIEYLLDLINVLSFVNNQIAAEDAHKAHYADNNGGMSIPLLFKMFHTERNKALSISPEQMEIRIKRFYDEKNLLITKKRKRDILAILDKHDLIFHGTYDFMRSFGKPPETALKVGEIAKRMAVKMNVAYRPENVPDLFNKKLDLNFGMIKKLKPYKT